MLGCPPGHCPAQSVCSTRSPLNLYCTSGSCRALQSDQTCPRPSPPPVPKAELRLSLRRTSNQQEGTEQIGPVFSHKPALLTSSQVSKMETFGQTLPSGEWLPRTVPTFPAEMSRPTVGYSTDATSHCTKHSTINSQAPSMTSVLNALHGLSS